MNSLRGYCGSKDGLMPFVKQTVEYARTSSRSGVTVTGDMGSFFYYKKQDDLIEWEMKLRRKLDMQMKGFCPYHMHDFKRFSETDKVKLYRHHTKIVSLSPSLMGS